MTFTQIFIIYLIIINILGFLIMGLDKYKAKMGDRRIPENTLFTFTVLGGGVGTIAGMYVFHHKTKKKTLIIVYDDTRSSKLLYCLLLQ